MRKMFIAGVILFFAFMVGTIISSGGSIPRYINIPSFLMVLGPAFVLLLANFSVREMGRAFAVGFRRTGAPPEDLKKGYLFFRTAQLYLILSGFLGTMIGAMAMLVNLRDSTHIGWGAALALITVLYGVIFSMVITIPFSAGIKKRLIEAEESIPPNR